LARTIRHNKHTL